MPSTRGSLTIRFAPGATLSLDLVLRSGHTYGLSRLPNAEPHHLIVPYFSKRKVAQFVETVNQPHTATVAPDLRYLTSKLARLANRDYPAADKYRTACKEILGFIVTAIRSPNGQRPGVYVDTTRTIPIEAMGEGVPNIVGLLSELAVAEGKLFLIEEPENDIHPNALTALLDLMLESAEHNQFIVSTHSNVVVRHLGSHEDSTVHYIDSDRALPPTAIARRVAEDPAARIGVLRDLGYELYDFHLWDGWLVLEESSAERIIRDYLIPFFAPQLKRVRTVAVGGNSQVEPAFADFDRLFRFTHLEHQYRNRAWVVIDGDDGGQRIVAKMRERYKASWEPDRFRCLSETDFESYYPGRFADAATEVLSRNGQAKREGKRELLNDVLAWANANEDEARVEFAESAREVIDLLSEIERSLFPDN